MIMYKLVNDEITHQPCSISLLKDNVRVASIPFDPANTDYQAFLKYQAEGGKVYGADEEVPNGQATE
jgi:hypothetical protein